MKSRYSLLRVCDILFDYSLYKLLCNTLLDLSRFFCVIMGLSCYFCVAALALAPCSGTNAVSVAPVPGQGVKVLALDLYPFFGVFGRLVKRMSTNHRIHYYRCQANMKYHILLIQEYAHRTKSLNPLSQCQNKSHHARRH